MRTLCPICADTDPIQLFERIDAPILMHKLYATAAAARAAKLGPLEMVCCRNCGFAWNRLFDASLIEYAPDYENNQTFSKSFSDHLSDRMSAILSSVPGDTPIDYLEIGCGQGDFMRLLVGKSPSRFRNADGFDTVWRGTEAADPNGIRIHSRYFDKATAAILEHPPNIVVSRHTIEHVPDPIHFLTSIRDALGPQSRTTIFIETPCAGWIIDNDAVQDFFYEHCSIFTADSLSLALEKSGFSSTGVERVFGGQYLWAQAVAGERNMNAVVHGHPDISSLDRVRSDFVARWSSELESARSRGTVAIWGAGAKGITFALLLRKPEAFDHVVDINPGKQLHYMPGSGIPIVSPAVSAQRKPKTIFVMNPNYSEEISSLARSHGVDAAMIPIN